MISNAGYDNKDAYGNTVMKPIYQNSYLAGAVFELHAAENIVGKEGTTFYKKDELVEKLTTSGTGAVKSKVLPLGKYYLKEISAPDGYVFDSTPYNVTLSAVDKKTAVVEVKVSASNTFLPIRVTLRKEKENLKLTETKEGMIHQTIEVVPGQGFVFSPFSVRHLPTLGVSRSRRCQSKSVEDELPRRARRRHTRAL